MAGTIAFYSYYIWYSYGAMVPFENRTKLSGFQMAFENQTIWRPDMSFFYFSVHQHNAGVDGERLQENSAALRRHRPSGPQQGNDQTPDGSHFDRTSKIIYIMKNFVFLSIIPCEGSE